MKIFIRFRSIMVKILMYIQILLCIFVNFSCNSPSPGHLRVATNIWPGYELLYLAKNLGYYDRESIRLNHLPSSQLVARNLRAGIIEAGCLTLDETLGLLQDSVDLKIILVFDDSRGADVLMANKSITRLQELKGKRIGVENEAVGAVMLDAALQAGGLKIEDVEIVPIMVNEHLEAFVQHKVDAVVTFEPVKSQLLNVGATVLFNSAQIPGRIIDVLVVRTEVLKTHARQIQDLVNGYFKAYQYFRLHPQEAALKMQARLGKEPLQQFQGLYLPDLPENKKLLQGESAPILKSAQTLAELMLKRKLLIRPVTLKHFVEPAFLSAAKP